MLNDLVYVYVVFLSTCRCDHNISKLTKYKDIVCIYMYTYMVLNGLRTAYDTTCALWLGSESLSFGLRLTS